MSKNIILVILAILILNVTCQNQRLLTQKNTKSLDYFCQRFNGRDIMNDKAESQTKSNRAGMKTYFKTDGNQMFNKIISSNDYVNQGLTELQTMIVPVVFFVGPFIVGLILCILIWPFLLCCCCCPSCCPSKCCRKSQQQPYTKCQLIWPSVFLITALLLIVVASIVGITKSNHIQNSYYAVACSAAITVNDVIKGNVSSQGKPFIGVQPMIDAIGQFSTKATEVMTNFQNLQGTPGVSTTFSLSTAITNSQNYLNKIADINNLDVNDPYKYTLDVDTPSLMPSILGDQNKPDTIVGGMYKVISQVNKIFIQIKNNVGKFTASNSITSVLDDIKQSIKPIQQNIQPLDDTLYDLGQTVNPIMKIITTVVTAIFGVFIGLGSLGIVATVLMTFCQKFKFRYILYFVCLIFVVLGIVCFFITLIFSLITPVLYLGCDFLQITISNNGAFKNNIGNFNQQVGDIISTCLPGGDGELLDSLGLGDSIAPINGVKDAIKQINSFKFQQTADKIKQKFNQIQEQFLKYYYTEKFDFFTNSANLALFKKIAYPTTTNYPSCSGPFINQYPPSQKNTQVGCNTKSNQKADIGCPSTDVSGTLNNCKGCIDVTHALYITSPTPIYPTSPGSTDTITEPSSPTCGDWNNDFLNLKANYYDQKKKHLDGPKYKLQQVIKYFKQAGPTHTNSDDYYYSNLAMIQTQFTNIQTSLSSTLDSVFNQKTGLMSSLNCQLLGQDINLVVSTTCDSLFNVFYFLRITLAMVAFGILFSLCCITCSGVRSYKQSQRLLTNGIVPGELSGGNIQMINMNKFDDSSMVQFNKNPNGAIKN